MKYKEFKKWCNEIACDGCWSLKQAQFCIDVMKYIDCHWFCPKQRLSQLKWLYKEHNDLWNILKDMEKDSFNTFKPNITLKDLEERFENELLNNLGDDDCE